MLSIQRFSVCVVSIVRATYVSQVSIHDGPCKFRIIISFPQRLTSITGNDTYGAIWSIVETCLAVVGACLPTLRPLYHLIVHGDPTGQRKRSYGSSYRLGFRSSNSRTKVQAEESTVGSASDLKALHGGRGQETKAVAVKYGQDVSSTAGFDGYERV